MTIRTAENLQLGSILRLAAHQSMYNKQIQYFNEEDDHISVQLKLQLKKHEFTTIDLVTNLHKLVSYCKL